MAKNRTPPRPVLARGDWWEIRAAAQPRSAELLIYGDIGADPWGGESVGALDVVRVLADLDVDTLTARINSYGGSVADGLAIYNALQRHPAAVTTAIDGVAVSIASLIAMAGDTVQMAQNGRLMIHAPWGLLMGNAADAREFADMLDGYAKSMAPSYAAKTGQTVDEVASLLLDGKDHWYSADEALAAGFVDEITGSLAIAASLPDRFRPGSAGTPAAPAAPHATPAAPAAHQPEGNPMPGEIITPPANVVDLDAERAKARAEALAADATRRSAVQAAFARHMAVSGVQALLETCLADHACTPEAAGLKLLDHIGSQGAPINGALALAPGEDEQDKRVLGQVDALLARMGRSKADGANPYRGLSLGEMARASLERAGVAIKGRPLDELAPLAMARGGVYAQSTSDFPVVLENTLHKLMLAGFMAAPSTWERWCKIGDVSDFRAWKRLVPGLIGNLDTVGEDGEYKNKAFPDATANSVQATRRGNIAQITPEVIVNDDIGYISDMATAFGPASKRAVERAVYVLLESNPTLSDGVALFHATHGNLAGSGAAPTVALLDAAAVAMAQQTAPGADAEYLDIRPDVALVNTTLRGAMRVLVDAVYDPDTANKLQRPNMVNGIVRDIVDTPRIAAAPWYLFADPTVNPVVEVVFLNGQREPRLAQEESFRSGGLAWRVEFPFGVGAIDYRGAYKNPGL